ncbi:MAG: UbiA prenyltransferase family protein [Thermoplasmata archaeon]|nr:MAG: UbiA prenyltransferase family protein [Thermoplasmata archaeon]
MEEKPELKSQTYSNKSEHREAQRGSVKDYIKAYTTISRYEYLPGVAPGMLIPLLLALHSFDQLISFVFIEAFTICLLLYFSGFIINSLADRELDKKYKTFKTRIPEAVEFIGIRYVKTILGIQVVAALLLSLHLTIVLNNIWLIVLTSVGALFGLGYSVEPFYFKVKGIWHAIALCSSAFFIPMMFLYMVMADGIELLSVVLILAIMITHYSISMSNQAADHLEDMNEGVLTPTVRFGLERTLKWSIYGTTAGIVLTILTMGTIYFNSDILSFIGSGSEASSGTTIALLAIVAVIIVMGYYIPLKGLSDLHWIASDRTPLEERMVRIDERINYARWQASGISGVTITLAILVTAGFLMTMPPPVDEGYGPLPESELDVRTLQFTSVSVVTANEGRTDNYAEVTVQLWVKNVENQNELTNVMAVVTAGTAGDLEIDSSFDYFDENGQTNVKVDLYGHNESEVWYLVHLHYNGEISSHTWTEPSDKNLYIFDAKLTITAENRLYDNVELVVNTYNSGDVRMEDSILIKVEWSPLIVDWYTNNATVNTKQVWEARLHREILKEWLGDSSEIKIYLYFEDEEVDEAVLQINNDLKW